MNCPFVCFSSLLLYIHLRLNNVLFQRSLKHTKHVYFASRKNKICMKNRIFNVSLTQGISLFLWCSKYSCKLFSMLIEFFVRNKKELNFQICSNCLVNIWGSSAAKKRQHPQFSGVVRNVGEKKWLQRKKEGRKRGGWRRGNLSRCALQTMYNFSINVTIFGAICLQICVQVSIFNAILANFGANICEKEATRKGG